MNVSTARFLTGSSLALVLCALACEKQPPPGARDGAEGPERSEAPRAGTPILPRELTPSAPSARRPSGAPSALTAPPAAPDAPYTGPWFAVTSPAAGVYSDTSFERNKKIGFMRSGGRTPVDADKLEKKNCSGGWYKVRSGGFVCGKCCQPINRICRYDANSPRCF